MTELAKAFLIILLSVLGGYLSAEMISGLHGVGTVQSGAWFSWPQADAREGGLYARYHHLRRGELPLSRFLGRRFKAMTDDDGHDLRGGCRYVLEGTLPPARFWTLALYPAEQNRARNARNSGVGWLSAEDALPDPKGRLRIVVDARMQPGTWLRPPVGNDEKFMIILRLYGLNPLARDRMDMPMPLRIRREAC